MPACASLAAMVLLGAPYVYAGAPCSNGGATMHALFFGEGGQCAPSNAAEEDFHESAARYRAQAADPAPSLRRPARLGRAGGSPEETARASGAPKTGGEGTPRTRLAGAGPAGARWAPASAGVTAKGTGSASSVNTGPTASTSEDPATDAVAAQAPRPARQAPSAEELGRTFDASAARPDLGAVTPDAGSRQGASAVAAAAPGKVFVAVDLDVGRGGDYRDAVAELQRSAAFTPEPGLSALRGARPGHLSVRGWMPSDLVRKALGLAHVDRVRAGATAQAAADKPEWKVTLHWAGRRTGSPATQPPAAFADALLRLHDEGLEWKRTLSFDAAAGRAVIRGAAQARDIGRLLADPAVLRVDPAPLAAPAGRAEGASGLEDPLGLISRHPVLLLLALLFPLAGQALRSHER